MCDEVEEGRDHEMEFKEVSGKATAIGIAEMLPWWRSLAGLFGWIAIVFCSHPSKLDDAPRIRRSVDSRFTSRRTSL